VPCGCPAAFLVSLKSAYQSAVAILGQIWVSKSLRVVKQETHRVEMRRAELASRCAECPFPWFLAARPPSFRQAQDLAYVTTPQSQRFDAAVGGDSAASQASPLRWGPFLTRTRQEEARLKTKYTRPEVLPGRRPQTI